MEPSTTPPVATVPLIDKDSYYKDLEFVSFSMLKCYSFCPTLFEDTYITKVYEEGDQDYFTYGKLVDAMLTESPKFVEENFAMVERKVKIEDALKIETKIGELQAYIDNPDFMAKCEKGNLTSLKGLESRKKQIAECEESLALITSLSKKIQVTTALWREADETATAIKAHPYFVNLTFNEISSQQIFAVNIGGIKRKGRLDHLKLSPAIERLYTIYTIGKMTQAQLKEEVQKLNPNDLWAIITDVKTCYSMKELEPANDHYLGQLAYYRELVSNFIGIPYQNIKCRILAGDKQNGKIKMAELFEYTQSLLDQARTKNHEMLGRFSEAMQTKTFVSQKESLGMQQFCFKCSKCRFCPFSQKPGDPVIISELRFPKRESKFDSNESAAAPTESTDY